jgi:hypothetical protein
VNGAAHKAMPRLVMSRSISKPLSKGNIKANNKAGLPVFRKNA